MALPLPPTPTPKKNSNAASKKDLASIQTLESIIKDWKAEHKDLTQVSYIDFIKLDVVLAPHVTSIKYGGFGYWSYTHLIVVMSLLDNNFKWRRHPVESSDVIDGINVPVSFTFLGKESEIYYLSPMSGKDNRSTSWKFPSLDKFGGSKQLDYRDINDAAGRCLAKAVAFELGLGMRCWVQPEAVHAVVGQEPVDYVPVVQVPQKAVSLGNGVASPSPFSPQVPPAPLGIPQNQPLPQAPAPAPKVAAVVTTPPQTIQSSTGQAQITQQVTAAFNPPQLPQLPPAQVVNTLPQAPAPVIAPVNAPVQPTPAPAPVVAPKVAPIVPASAPALPTGPIIITDPAQTFSIAMVSRVGFQDYVRNFSAETLGKFSLGELSADDKLLIMNEYNRGK